MICYHILIINDINNNMKKADLLIYRLAAGAPYAAERDTLDLSNISQRDLQARY